jgi:hypothetical protein
MNRALTADPESIMRASGGAQERRLGVSLVVQSMDLLHSYAGI